MNDLIFLSPPWLLLLPLLWWLVHSFTNHFRRQSMWMHVCDRKLLPLLNKNRSKQSGGNWLAILLNIVLTAGILALAGPSWQKQDYPLLESAAARVLLLDLSQSMLIEDVKPNRLEKALDITRQIIDSDFDGETALVAFAGAAFTVSPLTRDADTLLEFTSALSPEAMPLDGSRLDLAIDRATRLLAASITGSGRIFVITDGSSHFEQTTSMAVTANRSGNHIFVLAIGSLQGGPMKTADGGLKRSGTGQFIISKPNFDQLESISRTAQGSFIKVARFNPGIDSILHDSDTVASRRIQDLKADSFREPENGGFWLVWLILPVTLLLFRKNAFWLLFVAIVMPADQKAYAMDINELWFNSEQRAFQAYQKGRYAEARDLSENGFLTGSTLYKTQDYSRALEYFSQENSARSFYNRGNTLAYQGKLKRALEAYQQALILQPEFEDAQFNQKLIERYLNDSTGSEAGQSDEDSDSSNLEEPQEDTSGQSNPGQISEISDFRDQSEQPGVGASPSIDQSGFSEEEDIGEIELMLQQFLLKLQAENYSPDPETVRLWTDSIYADPAELFKRKFFRDHLRNQKQQR